jgi:hypothetical protein
MPATSGTPDILPIDVQMLRWLKEKTDRLDEVLDAAAVTAADGDWQAGYLDVRAAAEVVATWVSAVLSPHRASLGHHPSDPAMGPASRDEPVTTCGLCGKPLAAGQRQWCSNAHRQAAYRRRHQSDRIAAALPPPRSRRETSVYECPDCEARFAGSQYCLDCHIFARRVGPGGSCPHCDEAVAVSDLIDGEEVMPEPVGPKSRHSART